MLCLCSCCYAVIGHPQPLSLPAPQKHSTKLRGVTHIQTDLFSCLKIREGAGEGTDTQMWDCWEAGFDPFSFGSTLWMTVDSKRLSKKDFCILGWFYELSKKLVIWGGVVAWWFYRFQQKKTLLLPVADEIFFSKGVYDRVPKWCKLNCIHFCLRSLQQQDQMGKLSHHKETPKKRVDFRK